MSRQYAFSKMQIEDPEELKHRKAQFLIYKVLQRADSLNRPSWLRVRMRKLKIKIGKRLKRLRKSIFLAISTTVKNGVYKQVFSQLKTCKRLFGVRETMATLPPIFTIWNSCILIVQKTKMVFVFCLLSSKLINLGICLFTCKNLEVWFVSRSLSLSPFLFIYTRSWLCIFLPII